MGEPPEPPPLLSAFHLRTLSPLFPHRGPDGAHPGTDAPSARPSRTSPPLPSAPRPSPIPGPKRTRPPGYGGAASGPPHPTHRPAAPRRESGGRARGPPGTAAIRDLPGRADTCGQRPTPPRPARPSFGRSAAALRIAGAPRPQRSAGRARPDPRRAAPQPRTAPAGRSAGGGRCRRARAQRGGTKGGAARPGPARFGSVRPAHPRWR